MSILTPYHLVKIFRLWVFLRPVSWQQQIYWEHIAVAVNHCNNGHPHFTSWLHLYMLTDIHSPLIDRNLRNVDTRGDTIAVFSLPIPCPQQYCLRAVCDALIEVLLPPSHPAHHEGSDHNQYIDHVYYESIGGVDEDGYCSFASHNSAHKLIDDHLQWLRANIYSLTCELQSYEKDRNGFIIINLHLALHEQLSKQRDREACLESMPQRRQGDGPRQIRHWRHLW